MRKIRNCVILLAAFILLIAIMGVASADSSYASSSATAMGNADAYSSSVAKDGYTEVNTETYAAGGGYAYADGYAESIGSHHRPYGRHWYYYGNPCACDPVFNVR